MNLYRAAHWGYWLALMLTISVDDGGLQGMNIKDYKARARFAGCVLAVGAFWALFAHVILKAFGG